MSLEETEEDYWASSSLKNNKKKVNIFDDNVTVEAAADLAKFQKSLAPDDDFEDEGSISWGDDPVTTLSTSSSVGRLSDQSIPKTDSSQARRSHRADSGQNLSSVAYQDGYPVIEKPSVTPSRPETSYAGSRQEQAMTSYAGSRQEQAMTSYAGSRQEQEIQYLKQQLASAQNALGMSKMLVDEAVMRLLNGQPVSLEHFKSKEKKLALLDKAIATHDGNAIIAAVVFLKQTLRKQLFNMELLRRPVAVDQYLNYLKAQFSVDEYTEMLELLPDRHEELAMYRYKQATKVADSAVKIQRLQTCCQTFFETVMGMEHDCSLIQQQISLLQRQRPIDVADDMLEKQGKHIIFNQVPRVASITNQPLITTLYYCCLYHYDEGENLLSSPASIRKEHQLTEKQFVWMAVKARARLHKWHDIDALFTTKGFFGSTKKRCPIGFNRVASILHKAGASPDIVCPYLMLIDDLTVRLELAHKLHCPDAVVETYKAQRDKQGLSAYFSRLTQHSREWFLARDALNDQSIKWK